MRVLLVSLLVATTAFAADPYEAALRALSDHNDDPTQAIPALRALRSQLRERDRPVVDQVIAAMGKPGTAYAEATSELLRRWSASAPDDVKVQERVISTLYLTARSLEPDAAKPELVEESLRRGRELARSHPRDVEAQRFVGSLLGDSNEPAREALTVLARCLELDPKEKSCRAMFSEISKYYLSPGCPANLIKDLELRAGDERFGRESFVEVAGAPKPDGSKMVAVRMTEPARLRLARLTAALIKSRGEALVVVGKTRLHLQLTQPLDKQLVDLPHIQLSEVCREISTPTLPAEWRKWAE